VQKETVIYDSPIDALVAVAKRLSILEERYGLSSSDFFHKYSAGQMEDSVDFVEWSNAYEHFMAIREKIEKKLRHAA
jgi:hypothetical protein